MVRSRVKGLSAGVAALLGVSTGANDVFALSIDTGEILWQGFSVSGLGNTHGWILQPLGIDRGGQTDDETHSRPDRSRLDTTTHGSLPHEVSHSSSPSSKGVSYWPSRCSGERSAAGRKSVFPERMTPEG